VSELSRLLRSSSSSSSLLLFSFLFFSSFFFFFFFFLKKIYDYYYYYYKRVLKQSHSAQCPARLYMQEKRECKSLPVGIGRNNRNV